MYFKIVLTNYKIVLIGINENNNVTIIANSKVVF